MFKVLIHKTSRNGRSEGSDSNNAFSRMRQYCEDIQQQVARRLQQHFDRLSLVSKHACTLLFVLGGMAIFTSVIYQSIKIRSPATQSFYVISKSQPLRLIKSNAIGLHPDISMNDNRSIIRINEYIDSLSKTTTGKALLDSIIKVRPGLFDSLSQLKSLNQYNNNNK